MSLLLQFLAYVSAFCYAVTDIFCNMLLKRQSIWSSRKPCSGSIVVCFFVSFWYDTFFSFWFSSFSIRRMYYCSLAACVKIIEVYCVSIWLKILPSLLYLLLLKVQSCYKSGSFMLWGMYWYSPCGFCMVYQSIISCNAGIPWLL